jgi:hypothetical protein
MALAEGTNDVTSIVVGSWSEIMVEFPALSGTWLPLGNCPNGVVEISKEDYLHEGTGFPRKTDLVVPIRAGMKFTGEIQEINAENVRTILGMDPSDANPYIYAGALSTPTYFTFRAKRARNSDAVEITFKIFKAQASGLFTLGEADEAISSPIEIIAVDDTAGAYGGSAEAPLGYLWIPARA